MLKIDVKTKQNVLLQICLEKIGDFDGKASLKLIIFSKIETKVFKN